MPEDLSAGMKDYAIYLPAVQLLSAVALQRTDKPLKSADETVRFTNNDLNWLEPSNNYWHYKWCLASAGHFAFDNRDNTINCKHEDVVVIGDSGGFQIATGALAEIKQWINYRQDPEHIMQLWEDSTIRHDLLLWLDTHCTYGMTIDMPLWAQGTQREGQPFHYLSEAQLIELNTSNLELIQEARDRQTGCKFLNVLQAYSKTGDIKESLASEEAWYNSVKSFPFEGWSLGGEVGYRGGIWRILRRLLIMRYEGLLNSPYNCCHILGVSQPIWAVAFTAIQQAIRETVNPQFTISFDSASPYQLSGIYSQYASLPLFSDDLNTWRIPSKPIPTGFAVANELNAQQFGGDSPIAKLMNLQQLNPRKDPFAPKTTDDFADQVMINHNIYVYIKSMILANDVCFKSKTAPTDLQKSILAIDKLFKIDDWQDELDGQKAALSRVII